MKILISGSEGFVGRAFRRILPEYYPGADYTFVDIKTGIDARDFFRVGQTKYDIVIHLAAVVGGRETIDGSPLLLADNLAIDAGLFSWAERTRPGKIVYFSSSAAYPTRLQEKWALANPRLEESYIDLKNIDTPDALYGWAKLTGEMLADIARTKHDLDVLVVRPFSGYGSDQDLTYPFPSFIDRALRREDPFVVWGDGKQSRDFIHIDDVVHATLTAAQRGLQGPVNLGSGVWTSFNELARMVCHAAGYAPQIKHLEDKPTGMYRRVADVTYMNQIYVPQISLQDGIERAIEENKNNV